MSHDEQLYRRGVGVVLVNSDKLVWTGRRIDYTDEAWQMPQGGIDDGEEPWSTALRELQEETGILPRMIERVAELPERMRYDLPPELRGELWRGRYIGQIQDWFLARFLGTDEDVDIATQTPEFSQWRWSTLEDTIRLIVPFKRDMYRRIFDGFAPYL
jgi:putative (di)nucleoside polyphosphate hydrolase